jgi:hypothetical protein
MKELAISSCSNLIYDSGLKINENSSRNMFSRSSLREKRVEGVVAAANRLVRRHLAIGLNSVFQAVEFPASVSHLDSSLTNMNRNTLTL